MNGIHGRRHADQAGMALGHNQGQPVALGHDHPPNTVFWEFMSLGNTL